MFGFYRIAAAVPRLVLCDPEKNLRSITKLWEEACERRVAAVVFPELCLTGYTAGDLFEQERLYESQLDALRALAETSRDRRSVAIVGVALRHEERLFNCAAVIQAGRIVGIVPKTYLPNRREYYERRWFVSAREAGAETISLFGQEIPFGNDLLFDAGGEFPFGVEICEDLWAPTPVSNALAIGGARVVFNLSASNELVSKADYRLELVRTQSARLVCAYAYASSGIGESGTDTVFGGDSIIAEYGSVLARGERFFAEDTLITAEIDVQRLGALRRVEGSFYDVPDPGLRTVTLDAVPYPGSLTRSVDPHPFVPKASALREERCEEIIRIQSHALLRRMEAARSEKALIGVSGGLDSTLALLSSWRAFEIAQKDPSDIIAVTMPGPGTSTHTRTNAHDLCQRLGVTCREIPIADLVNAQLKAIGHDPDIHDVTYENVQARIRTSILMNLANQEGGLVVGTGDLSEIALGWSTYNGDHMSMYALNAGIPKTLVRYVVEHYTARYESLRTVLEAILHTPVSPELIPTRDDRIVQETESIIGPYELHDFFLYHFLKYGASPAKIHYLATRAFADRYDAATIAKWLRVFLRRFFTQQFKRSCMPDGPKVGTIALSPRADWRMPSDADDRIWLEACDDID